MNTEIISITDKSSSMSKVTDSTIKGFNAFLNEQKLADGEARLSHVLFSSWMTQVCQAVPVLQAPYLGTWNYQPEGMTALYDTIGHTLTVHAERIARQKWAHQVIVTILTDGEENASISFNRDRIRELIQHCERFNWKFMYLGANQDSFAVAGAMGIARGQTMNYAHDNVGTQNAFSTMSQTVGAMRAGGVGSTALQDHVVDVILQETPIDWSRNLALVPPQKLEPLSRPLVERAFISQRAA